MNAVKEIQVTDSFLGLDQEVKGCQITETFENCTTNEFKEKSMKHCGCLPFNIRLTDKVVIRHTQTGGHITASDAPVLLRADEVCEQHLRGELRVSAGVRGAPRHQLHQDPGGTPGSEAHCQNQERL